MSASGAGGNVDGNCSLVALEPRVQAFPRCCVMSVALAPYPSSAPSSPLKRTWDSRNVPQVPLGDVSD